MLRVAVLEAVVVLAAAENPVVPVDLSLAPLVIVTHGALLVEVQAQPDPVETVTRPVPPLAGSDWLPGVSA